MWPSYGVQRIAMGIKQQLADGGERMAVRFGIASGVLER
jgi:hypothetical protein